MYLLCDIYRPIPMSALIITHYSLPLNPAPVPVYVLYHHSRFNDMLLPFTRQLELYSESMLSSLHW